MNIERAIEQSRRTDVNALIAGVTNSASRKPRYRYNWDKQKWSQLYTFSLETVVIPGTFRPDGTMHSFTVPPGPIADLYRNEYASR